jgi:hypothetical protein
MPLNVTPVVPVNFLPVTGHGRTHGIDVGLNEVTDGASGDDEGGADPSPRLQLTPALMQSFTGPGAPPGPTCSRSRTEAPPLRR